MPRYFVCSIGQPGEGYDDENLCRCIVNKGYFLHVGCTHQGPIAEIQSGDLLILKYQNELIAYGRTIDIMQKKTAQIMTMVGHCLFPLICGLQETECRNTV